MRLEVVEGDAFDVLAGLEPGSVSAIVTDPPYGIGFMGQKWDTYANEVGRRPAAGATFDHVGGNHNPSNGADAARTRRVEGQRFGEWCETWATLALRALKPGGYIVAFGGTRTFHRLACAIEDAGFEIRDNLAFEHMAEVFCQCDNPRHGHDDVRGVRDDVRDVAADVAAGEGADVLEDVQRDATRQGVGEARAQGPGGVDGSVGGELPREDDRAAQSGVEGRRHAQAAEGELPRGAVRPGADVGAANGAGGRLRDGAPARHGDADGVPADSDGGRPSSGPRSVEQSAGEPRAMAVEWITQGGGAWPGCPGCGKPLAPPFFGGPLAHMYGQGFPKSLDVSKAIDAAAGATREVVGPDPEAARRSHHRFTGTAYNGGRVSDDGRAEAPLTAPATPEAAAWSGWGTALKPAHEPIVLARKPLAGTVAGNVLAHGTGALNVDGCRIDAADAPLEAVQAPNAGPRYSGVLNGGQTSEPEARTTSATSAGRWPANVLMDEAAAAILDEQAGERGPGRFPGDVPRATGVHDGGQRKGGSVNGEALTLEAGGASRFLYVAKADTAERQAGLGVPSLFTPADAPTRNDHPTVKPVDVMRWLVRLVTPPGGLVLDPFTGSGTTGIACALEGFDFLGVEKDPESVAVARARIAHWSNGAVGHDR